MITKGKTKTYKYAIILRVQKLQCLPHFSVYNVLKLCATVLPSTSQSSLSVFITLTLHFVQTISNY